MRRYLIWIALILSSSIVACNKTGSPIHHAYSVQQNMGGGYFHSYEADSVRQDGNCVKLYLAGDDITEPRQVLCGNISVTRQ